MGRYGGFANQAGAMMHADFDRTEKLAGEPSAHRDNRQWQTRPNQRSRISAPQSAVTARAGAKRLQVRQSWVNMLRELARRRYRQSRLE